MLSVLSEQHVYGQSVGEGGPSMAWVAVILLFAAMLLAGAVMVMIIKILSNLLHVEHYESGSAFGPMLLLVLVVAVVFMVQIRGFAGSA